MKKVITLLTFVLLLALRSIASGVAGTNEPLSLGLLSFYGYNKGTEVMLEWEAMTWSTSRMFTIERSEDGVRWTAIQEVTAETGDNRAVRYSATDRDPIIGNGYYRVGFANDLGERAVSNPIRIHTAAGTGKMVSLYPNPCTDRVNLAGVSAGSTVSVSNSAGREIFRSASSERLSISTEGWQSGIYFVTISGSDGKVIRSRVVRL